MEEEKVKALDNKEVSDALHMLLHCSLKDTEYETQVGQFHIVYDYIEQLEKENEFWKEYKEKLDKLDAKDFIFKHELENYIPKSVIRDKIEELEEMLPNQYVHIDYTKKILKELLGEEKC